MGRPLVLALAALLLHVSVIAEPQLLAPTKSKYFTVYNPYMAYGQSAYNPYPATNGYAYGQNVANSYGQYVSSPYGQYGASYQPGVSYLAGNVLVANAGSTAARPGTGSYVYSNNNLAAVTGRVVIVSDYDPLAGKSLDLAAFGGKVPAKKVSGRRRRRRRRRQTSSGSCEFVSNARLNTVVSSNTLTRRDALLLIASPLSTPFNVTRILANRATLLALGQRTNLYVGSVPVQKARTPAEIADIDAANAAIRALASAEANVHVVDYASKVTEVLRLGTSLSPIGMCAWVRTQVTTTGGNAGPQGPSVPAPSPVAPAPSPVAPAPSPVAPAPSPVAPAPSPVAPAPSPVVPAPSPVAPAPSPVVPAPSPVVPAPSPVVPAPSPVVPAPSPVVPAPIPAVTTLAPTTTPATDGGGTTDGGGGGGGATAAPPDSGSTVGPPNGGPATPAAGGPTTSAPDGTTDSAGGDTTTTAAPTADGS